MGFENLTQEFELSEVPAVELSKELELRHVAEAAQEPLFEHIARNDALAPLLHMIVGQALPFL